VSEQDEDSGKGMFLFSSPSFVFSLTAFSASPYLCTGLRRKSCLCFPPIRMTGTVDFGHSLFDDCRRAWRGDGDCTSLFPFVSRTLIDCDAMRGLPESTDI